MPILQEKLPSGSEELFDGIHDVWFLNPNDLTHDDPKWRDWEQKRPRDATLRGLLAGYFHYLAYELRAHSSVASIRARNLHKEAPGTAYRTFNRKEEVSQSFQRLYMRFTTFCACWAQPSGPPNL